jgi:hypothetical protein
MQAVHAVLQNLNSIPLPNESVYTQQHEKGSRSLYAGR